MIWFRLLEDGVATEVMLVVAVALADAERLGEVEEPCMSFSPTTLEWGEVYLQAFKPSKVETESEFVEFAIVIGKE